jgi:hypothetical protein
MLSTEQPMNTNSIHPRKSYDTILLTGVSAGLVAYLLLTLAYPRERTISDSIFYLFNVINREWFTLFHDRPISFCTQWLPLLGVKMGLPAKTLILLYALADWLYYAGSFALLAFVLKARAHAYTVVAALFLFNYHNFFNPVSELYQSMPLIVIAHVLLHRSPEASRGWLHDLCYVLLGLAALSHPLCWLLMLGLFGWTFISQTRNIRPLLPVVICIGMAALIFAGRADSYEKQLVLGNSTVSDSLAMMKDLFKRFLTGYADTALLIAINVLGLIHQRKILAAALFLFGVLSYITLVFVLVGHQLHNNSAFERYLFPMSVVVIFVFLSHVLPYLSELWTAQTRLKRTLSYALWILVPLCIIGRAILWTGPLDKLKTVRSNRIDNLVAYMQELPAQKIWMREDNVSVRYRDGSWSPWKDDKWNSWMDGTWTSWMNSNWVLGVETMVLTANRHNQPAKNLYTDFDVPESLTTQMPPNQLCFLNAGWLETTSKLNRRYFPFADSSNYLHLNQDTIQIGLPAAFWQSIALTPEVPATLDKDRALFFDLNLTNSNQSPLRSGMRKEKIQLAYRWFKPGAQQPADVAMEYTPIMADVYTRLRQEVKLKTPSTPGQYELAFGIMINDKWVHLSPKRTTVTIE